MRPLITLLFMMAVTPIFAADESPQTGPETEKRFPPLKVPAGFRATLFACDPLIEYPSAIALGPRVNTLFVAADYMTGLGTTDIIRRDEIRLVEDIDADGYADRAPVWADGFNSIQGLTYHDGTVFVMHAPYLTALRDTDGDGVAEERKNLFKGFGLGPEEDKVRLHNSNGIVAGHDGWLYLALGDRGCDVTRPEGDLLVLNGGGILRCRPDGRDLHVFSTGLRNIYDVALDDDLNVFTRDNENDGGNYKIRVCQSFFGADHGYPYLYDERPEEALAPLADLGLGSSAGGVYYRETQFPAEYRGLYFCEWGRAVMRYVPESPGKPFGTVKEIEFAAGAENDPYGFKPTDLVVDCDGSLLIADWADGQRPKRGRARIYRVQFVGRALLPDQGSPRVEPQGRAGVPILRSKMPNDLAGWIERLNSDSDHERLEAQFTLERRGRDGPAALVESLRTANLNEPARRHVVWILAHVQGQLASDELFKFAQQESLPSVQIQAIRALADLHDPVLAEHRLNAGPGSVDVAKRFAALARSEQDGVMLDVVVALGRLKWAGAPLWMSEKMRAMDPVVGHAAQQTLRRCGDWLAVLRLLDGPFETFSESPPRLVALRDVALRALADQADKRIVDWLEVRLQLATDPTQRREYAQLLSRVHRKPGPWVYWGFRPASRPANTVTWQRTEFIEQVLDRMLTDADHGVRLAVLRSMQREKIPIRLPTLADWLRGERNAERITSILDALREHPAEATREVLEPAIADVGKPTESRLAAFRLWSANVNDSREAKLIALAKSVEESDVLADILLELSARDPKAIGSESVGSLLLSKTKSEKETVRAAAIESLGRLRIADGAAALPALLQDRDARVRRAAAAAAGQLELSSVIDTLLNLARVDEVAVRQASLDALRQLREPRVVPPAVAALSDGTTQLSALHCLADFGGPEHSAAVIDVAKRNSSTEVVSLTVRMLSKWAADEQLDAARRAELKRIVIELQGASGLLLCWHVIGPVSSDEAMRIAASIDRTPMSPPSADSDVGARATFGEGPDARVQIAEQADNQHWLAYSDFDSSEPAAAQFLMSSNTPLRVWFNGKSVMDRKEARRFQPDTDRFEAELAKGTNRLLMQLSNVPDAAPEFHARIRRKSSKVEHERLVESALSRTGNVERGRKLFLTVEKSNCLKCHRLGEQGEKIGPELTGIGSRFSRIHIIESLLDPSRTIAAGFQSQTVAMNDGRVLSGLKISETADTLILADNQGKKHSLLKADIEETQTHAGSVMPDGLEKTLSVEEFVDLITFLTSEKQTAGR